MTARLSHFRLADAERAAGLSMRQWACLALAAEGLSSTGIGRRLDISGRTVDEHLMLACQALGVRTRIQAVARVAAIVGQPPAPPQPPSVDAR